MLSQGLPERSGSRHEASWSALGAVLSLLERSWSRLEASRSALAAVSKLLGALLEPSRGLSERSWSRLEAPWSRLERFRGPSGSDLSFFDVFRGQKREES